MGNKQETKVHRNFSISEWEFVECHNGCGLFRNRITQQQCQEYLLKVTSEKDKLRYQKRKSKRQEHLVNILHCEVFTNFDSQYTLIDFTVRIFLERISVRLQEIAQLPIDAIPLLIFECLLGFKKIFEEYEAIRVSANMIGFTQNKEVRVWLSPNFLENFVQAGSSAIGEQIMVEDIFNIFDRYSDLYHQRPELKTFTQALEYIAQLPSINKSQITLVKIPSDQIASSQLPLKSQLSLKHNISTGSKDNQMSPGSRSLLNKTVDAAGGSRQRLDTDQSSSDFRFFVQAIEHEQKSSRPYSPVLVNQKIHQRQISTVTAQAQQIHQVQQTPTFIRTESQNGSRKNLTVECGPSKPIHLKPMMIGIESARTTSNNMPLYDNFIELDDKSLQLQLLDDKRSKQAKLHMIEDVLVDHKDDENVKKVCKVYNYAIKFDPLMYHELQKAKGRISKISNQYVLRKLIQVSEQNEDEQYGNPLNSESNISGSWAKIKTEQNINNSSFMKIGSQEKIRRILVKQRMKRGDEPDMKKAEKNKTFFGTPQQQKAPRKTAMETSHATFAKPRCSEAAPSQSQVSEDMNKRRATAFQLKKAEEQKKPDKKQMMETFKKEFDKLFEF